LFSYLLASIVLSCSPLYTEDRIAFSLSVRLSRASTKRWNGEL